MLFVIERRTIIVQLLQKCVASLLHMFSHVLHKHRVVM